MPHELDMTRGTAAIAYAGETPWHKLGTRFDELMTSEQALTAAGLDFTVVKVPVTYQHPVSGETINVDGKFVTVRDDAYTPLGVVGAAYQPVQNADAFSFLDSLVASSELRYETAGALFGGSQVWMLAKLPDSTRLSHDDVVDHYLLMTNGHCGHRSCSIGFTTVRVVCNNTLSIAIPRMKHEYKVRHSGSISSKLAEAQYVLGLAKQTFGEFRDAAVRMSFKTYKSQADIDEFIDHVLGSNPKDRTHNEKTVHNQINQLLETGLGADLSTAKNTYWGLLNAVTEWVDHYKPQQNRYGTSRDKDEARLDMITWGGGNRMKQRAYEFAASV